ncbi:MAG: hypothetical protein AB7I50_19765 [Vicinamibacterales bacterium]
MAACLFCGAEGPGILTNEHVMPEWLLKYLGYTPQQQITHGVADSETGAVTKQRTHSAFTFVDGRVCGGCNHGWMSRLEDAARPILIPMMEGERQLADLTLSEREILGKWTAKTAYMHSWAGLLKQPVQLEHLHSLYADLGTVAPRVFVVAAHATYQQLTSYLQSGRWAHVKLKGIEPQPDPLAYKITLQFKHLYLVTAYWPEPEVQFVLAPFHLLIWPIATKRGPVWPGMFPLDAPIHMTYRVSVELGLFHAPAIVLPAGSI